MGVCEAKNNLNGESKGVDYGTHNTRDHEDSTTEGETGYTANRVP